MKPGKGEGERNLAIFIDFENVGLGFVGRRDRFEIGKVLERMVEKGKIVAKKAYADWSRFADYTRPLHEAAIELIEIPRRSQTGKNSADIRLVVDAIDLAYSKDHIDTFVIVSGDSDFSPLVSKLKELGKHVIGLGLADATSDLLRDNCDEFIYYEDLDRAPIIPIETDQKLPEQKRKVFKLLLDSLLALRRENKELILSSMVKDTMKRKKPSFNEGYYGYRTFSELLEDAAREGLLTLEKHKNSGMYVVTRFGLEMQNALPARSQAPPGSAQVARSEERPSSDRRGRTRRGRGRAPALTEPPIKKALADSPQATADDRPLGRALLDEADDWDPQTPPRYPPLPAFSPPNDTLDSPPSASPVPRQRSIAQRSPAPRAPSRRRQDIPPPLDGNPPAPNPDQRDQDHDLDDFGAGLDV